jgi:hypothetical protein
MTAGATPESGLTDYAAVHADIVALLEAARRAAARSVNAVMTAMLLGNRPAHCRV